MSKFLGFLLGIAVALVGPAMFGVLAADGGIKLNAKEMALAYGIGALIFWTVVSYFSGAAALGAALTFGAMIYAVHWIPNRTTNFLNDVPGVTTGMIDGIKQYTLNGVVPILAVISLFYAIQLIVQSVQRRRRERAEAERRQREQDAAQQQEIDSTSVYPVPVAAGAAAGAGGYQPDNRFGNNFGNSTYDDLFEEEPTPYPPRNQADEQTAQFAQAPVAEADEDADRDETVLVPTDRDETVLVPAKDDADEQAAYQADESDDYEDEHQTADQDADYDDETVVAGDDRDEQETQEAPVGKTELPQAPPPQAAPPVAASPAQDAEASQAAPPVAGSAAPQASAPEARPAAAPEAPPVVASPAPEAEGPATPASGQEEGQPQETARPQQQEAAPVRPPQQPPSGASAGGTTPPAADTPSAPQASSTPQAADTPPAAQASSAPQAADTPPAPQASSAPQAFGTASQGAAGARVSSRGEEMGQQYRERMDGPDVDDTGEFHVGAFENPNLPTEAHPQAPRVMDLPGSFRSA